MNCKDLNGQVVVVVVVVEACMNNSIAYLKNHLGIVKSSNIVCQQHVKPCSKLV